MVVDQSRRKAWMGVQIFLVVAVLDVDSQVGITKLSLLTFFAQTLAFTERHFVAQRGITNPSQLVGSAHAALLWLPLA